MSTAASRLPRVRAELRVGFARAGARTEAARAYETGGWRLRFPRSVGGCEAVVVNTGGGMAGGDQVAITISVEPGAAALVTSQSQEKIYRADGLACRISARLDPRRRRAPDLRAAGDAAVRRRAARAPA